MSTDSEIGYYVPDSIPAVHRRLDGGAATRVIAGGQTLSTLLDRDSIDADTLVDVSDVPALSGVSVGAATAEIGPTTTYAELRDSPLGDRIGALGDACSVIGGRQVRNAGTVGGAVCHADPAFDIVAALHCLGARVRVGSVDGRRTVPLGALLDEALTGLGTDELLEAITVSLPDERTGTAYEKHAPVDAGWTTVGAGTRVTLEENSVVDARVTLAAVADTTVRAPAVEAALTGGPAARPRLAEASEAVAIDPDGDLTGSAAYKRGLAPAVVERSLATAVRRAGGAP